MKKEYIELYYSDKGPTYIRKDRIDDIKKVDVIVFDCDGVLLDVRESYKNAVSKTSSILIEAFTGYKIPDDFFDERLYFAYKKTGGFNNDWTHTYAYLMKTLSELSPENLQKIDKISKRSLKLQNIAERLNFIEENKITANFHEKELYESLLSFTSRLDSSGVEAVDRVLSPILGENVKKALNYRAGVGESIISTLFEEIFGGSELFSETFGVEPQFIVEKEGLVEKNDVILEKKTLSGITKLIGNRVGIASSSLANTACYSLGALIDYFSEDSMVWHDNVDIAMKQTGRTDLHKPNPYPLLRASKPYNPYNMVLYVGDTMADKIMARKTWEIEPKFLFAGVYGHSSLPEESKQSFIEAESDIVTPSVNELHQILEEIRHG
jgi:phosphoglycolate phosphatase-like HAD superfamily hydrolase